MGLSLWLVPPSDVADKLHNIMKMKTPTYKSPSSFPHFHPHVTLATVASNTRVEDLRAVVPAGQQVVPIVFKTVEAWDRYFMSLFVTVHQDGSLAALREVIANALGENTVPPKAHVSLFYIDDSEPEERAKMMDELNRQKKIVSIKEDRVSLDCSPAGVDSPDLVDQFDGAQIWIALCDGPVETWSVKDKITLKRHSL